MKHISAIENVNMPTVGGESEEPEEPEYQDDLSMPSYAIFLGILVPYTVASRMQYMVGACCNWIFSSASNPKLDFDKLDKVCHFCNCLFSAH